MLRSRLCYYGDTYILVEGTIKVAPAPNTANKKVIFKNYAPFINCISRINSTQVDDAHDIGVVIPLYNIIECGDN